MFAKIRNRVWLHCGSGARDKGERGVEKETEELLHLLLSKAGGEIVFGIGNEDSERKTECERKRNE